MPTSEHRIAPPGRHPLFLEGRALLELAALVPAYPLLRRAPRGDGHPVIVLPGFMASVFSTRALRRFLHGLGYAVHGWEARRKVGPSPELATRIVAHLQDVRTRHGRRVSLVGWSLGGIYTRELARRFADDARRMPHRVGPVGGGTRGGVDPGELPGARADAGFSDATFHGWTGYRTSSSTQGGLVRARKPLR